jgi:hypothetical protein
LIKSKKRATESLLARKSGTPELSHRTAGAFLLKAANRGSYGSYI